MLTEAKIIAFTGEIGASSATKFVPPYGDRFVSCWQLWALGDELQKEQADDDPDHQDAGTIIWGTVARAIKTFRAVLILCALGQGEQATMLNRSLVEDALTVRWIELNRTKALALALEHERHTKHLWRETLEERGLDLGALADLPPLSEDDLLQLRDQFGRFGTKPWTGHASIAALVDELLPSWGTESEQDLLRHIHGVHLRHSNQTLHNTTASLVRPSFTDPDRPIYSAAQTERDIPIALLVGFWAFGNLFGVVLRPDLRGRFMSYYLERMPTFFTGPGEVAAD